MNITKTLDDDESVAVHEDYHGSVHTTDAEGELDDDQERERTVTEMLVSGLNKLLWTVSTNVLIYRVSLLPLLYQDHKLDDRLVVFLFPFLPFLLFDP
jgi:hypothetical protein